MDDFDFGILDVVILLDLKIRRNNPNSLDVDCPFCGGNKKGKLNINTKKNVFRCNRCDTSGGMLGLYGRIFGLSDKDAYKSISENLRHGNKPKYKEKTLEIKKKQKEVNLYPTASIDKRHIAYSHFLSVLTLSSYHKQKLLERGLSEFEIKKNGYRSVPVFGADKIISRLNEAGVCLDGIPGFYLSKTGYNMNLNPKLSGIIIPVKTIEGYISGFQIRLDNPFNDMKYLWFSSSKYNNGAAISTSPHFVGTMDADAIYLTEGALKADIAHFLSSKTFLAVAGVTQYNSLINPLKTLKILGFNIFVECFDMDKKTNENVKNALVKTMNIAKELGFETKNLTWDSKYKGIDDFLYSKKRSGING